MGSQISGPINPIPKRGRPGPRNGHVPFVVVPGTVNTTQQPQNTQQTYGVRTVGCTMPPATIHNNQIHQPAPVLLMEVPNAPPLMPQSRYTNSYEQRCGVLANHQSAPVLLNQVPSAPPFMPESEYTDCYGQRCDMSGNPVGNTYPDALAPPVPPPYPGPPAEAQPMDTETRTTHMYPNLDATTGDRTLLENGLSGETATLGTTENAFEAHSTAEDEERPSAPTLPQDERPTGPLLT